MGDEDVPGFVVNTQTKLGPILHNSKILTVKNLSRPPYGFIQDVVKGFMRHTNLLNGLFAPDELDTKKPSREDKVRFLDKLIAVVQYATGATLQANAGSIVAGKEAEYTNQLFSQLADVAALPPTQVNDAVLKTPGNVAPRSPARGTREKVTTPAETKSSPRGQSREKDQQQQQQQDSSASSSATNASGGASGGQPHAAVQRPGTASARRPPPRTESNEVVVDSSSGDVQPQQVSGVIGESHKKEEGGNKPAGGGGGGEQDWMKVVEQHENATSATRQQIGEGGAKSYLVSEALQAKQEQDAAAARAKQAQLDAEGGGAGAGGLVINIDKSRVETAGAMGDSEISKLREQLQLLTKASNPLGKYLEAIFDDIDSMVRELDMWRNEARTQSNAAAEAQRQTHESLRDVNAQLLNLEDNISDQLSKVSLTRAQIQKNEATIEKLIRMVINPSEHSRSL